MLKHVVMWKLKAEAEGKTKAENALWMKEHLEALAGVVPQIQSLEVGINCKAGEMAYDAVLIATFADEEALAAYKVDPRHVAVSSYCKKIRESRVVVDFREEENRPGGPRESHSLAPGDNQAAAADRAPAQAGPQGTGTPENLPPQDSPVSTKK